MTENQLDGKIIIVTGAAGGLGSARRSAAAGTGTRRKWGTNKIIAPWQPLIPCGY